MTRILVTIALLLSLVAPVLAGSQPTTAERFQTLAGTLQTIARNSPRAANASLTDVIRLNPNLTITQMEGWGEEPTYVSFQERLGYTYTQTDISADGKSWRQCRIIPRLYPAPELGMQVSVLGWTTSSGQWPGFQAVNPNQLGRWTNLLSRAITLRQNGGGYAKENGLLVVVKGQRKAGLAAWRKKHQVAASRIVEAPSDGAAAALIDDYAIRVGGPAMVVGFRNL